MIYRDTAQFLQRCLRDVPPTGLIEDQRFSESELTSFAADISNGPLRWQRFFRVETAADDDDNEDRYFLKKEVIAEEWAELIRDRPWFTSVSDPEWNDDYQCQVTAVSPGRGEITFPLYFHGGRIQSADPDPVAGVFPVWFVEPSVGEDREFVFAWYKFVDDDFWENLRTQLIQFQQPLSMEICRLDSTAVSDNEEGVEDYLRLVAKDQGHSIVEHPERERNCLRADDSISLDKTRFGVETANNSHLLVCDCNLGGSGTLHLHRVLEGEPVAVDEDDAEKFRSTSRSKISEYNDLVADRKNVEQFVKIIAGVAVISLIHFAIEVASFFGVELTTEGTRGLLLAGASILVPIIAFVVIIYALWPIARLRLFSWSRLRWFGRA